MRKLLILIITFYLLSGCAPYNIPAYAPENQNIEAIGKRPNKFNVAIVNPTFEDTGKIFCRAAGNITIQQDKTYSEYIIAALKSELRLQGLLDEKSDKIVYFKLSKIDFSSTLGSTKWLIDGEYVLNSSTQLISTVFNMDSNFIAHVACDNMGLNFPKALSQHLNQFYHSSIFLAAAGEKQTNKGAESLSAKLENLKKAFQDGLISEEEYNAKRNQLIKDY